MKQRNRNLEEDFETSVNGRDTAKPKQFMVKESKHEHRNSKRIIDSVLRASSLEEVYEIGI